MLRMGVLHQAKPLPSPPNPSSHDVFQFEAMSWALYKTRKFASNLRKLSLETMAAHPDMYARFLGADFPAYLA